MIRPHYVPLFQSICHSEKLADLPDHAARFFYVLLLTQTDSWGRMPGRPRVLFAKVWALYGALDDVEPMLAALAKVGLIERYTAGGEPYVAIPDWEQKAGRVGQASRRANSLFPEPELPDPSQALATPRDPSQGFPSEPSRTEPSRTEPRPRGSSGRGRPAPASAVAVVVEANIEPSETRTFTDFWVAAFQAACGAAYGFQGAKDGRHVQRILKRPGGLPEAKRRAAILLAAAPQWIANGGIDLGVLDAQWNKLASAGQTGTATGASQIAIGMANGRAMPSTGIYDHLKRKELPRP